MSIQNPYTRTVTTWVIITLAAVAMIFIPFIIGLDGMSGGFAISFVSFFASIVGVIVVLVYRGLASRYDDVTGGLDILAQWTYPDDFWRTYTESEYRESVEEVKPLLYLTSAMCLVAGIGVYIWDPEPGIWVLGVMLVVIVLMTLAAFLTRMHLRSENLRRPGNVIISKKAVLVNGNLFYWDYFGSRLESVEIRKDKDHSSLVFTTWAPTMQFGQNYSLRVPIPRGEESKASEIVSTLEKK
jgi:hypothetical protein